MRLLIPALVIPSLVIPALLGAATTIVDRIAIVVGRTAIKTSDIEREIRITQFLNGQAAQQSPAMSTAAQRRDAAKRLIDQALIRRDLAQSAGSITAGKEDAQAVLEQLRRERFSGSDTEMTAELRRRGLTPELLSRHLQWQLTVLRFIEERFRPGVLITDDEVAEYMKTHAAEQKTRVRDILEGEQINRNFEEWLDQTRKTARIDYKLDELR